MLQQSSREKDLLEVTLSAQPLRKVLSGKFWGLKSMFKNVVAEYQDSKSCLEWFLYVSMSVQLETSPETHIA